MDGRAAGLILLLRILGQWLAEVVKEHIFFVFFNLNTLLALLINAFTLIFYLNNIN